MPRAWNKRGVWGEMQMLSEYLAAHYPNDQVRMRVRMGTVQLPTTGGLSERDARAVNHVFLRWADAVVVTPTELIVIEAKMRADPSAISQLELYRELVPKTQELLPFLGRRIVAELVVSIEDPAVTAMASRRSIRVRVYKPAWLGEWAARRRRNESRPTLSGGLT